jgi:hypothetical protein
MTGEAAGRMMRLAAISAILSCAEIASVSFAKANVDCAGVVKRVALQAVNRTDPFGKMTVFGEPFAIEPSVIRVEVDVFGGDNPIYSVDVTIDDACKVLSTSTRLESRTDPSR